MALSDDLEKLVKRHGATSYRNRADTQHPAYGFTPSGLLNLLAEVTAEVRKQDAELIRQMLDALERCTKHDDSDYAAITAARARLGDEPTKAQPASHPATVAACIARLEQGGQSAAVSILRPLAERAAPNRGAIDLLEEVAACFTRDDDLPNGLLPRIDAMLTACKEGTPL